MNLRTIVAIIGFALITLQACSPAGGEERGHEFMPDMVHSTAYESNLYNYYFFNTWGTEEEYKKFVEPREPVAGTVPRGFAGAHYQESQEDRLMVAQQFEGTTSHTAMAYTPNGHVPYYYDNTEEERTRAMAEITENPYPITTEGLERGKELYTIYCAICHGDKGDGLGYIVREANPAKGITAGVYPAAPANFQQEEFYQASNGRYYHAIMYGKNVMGAHADKLSYEERWQVIHYIRQLQAKEQGLEYTQDVNTFAHGVPGADILAAMEAAKAAHDEEGHDDHGDHGDGHDGEHHGDSDSDHGHGH